MMHHELSAGGRNRSEELSYTIVYWTVQGEINCFVDPVTRAKMVHGQNCALCTASSDLVVGDLFAVIHGR